MLDPIGDEAIPTMRIVAVDAARVINKMILKVANRFQFGYIRLSINLPSKCDVTANKKLPNTDVLLASLPREHKGIREL